MSEYEVTVLVNDPESIHHTVVVEANSYTQAMHRAKAQVWTQVGADRYFLSRSLHNLEVLAVRQLDYTEPAFTDKLFVMLLRPVTGLARKLLGTIRRFKDE